MRPEPATRDPIGYTLTVEGAAALTLSDLAALLVAEARAAAAYRRLMILAVGVYGESGALALLVQLCRWQAAELLLAQLTERD